MRINILCSYPGCKKILNSIPSEIKRRKCFFCCSEHRYKWWAEQLKGEKNPSWKGGKEDVSCVQCGGIIKITPYQKKHFKYHLHRKCCSEWMKGKNNPFYGKHHTEQYKKEKSKNERKPFEIKEMTKEIAEVVGVFMGDGDDCHECGFRHGSIDKDFIDKTENNLKTFTPDNVPIHKYCNPNDKTPHGKQIYRIGVYNKNFADYLNKITNHRQKVPDEIMNGSIKIKMAFLQGLVDSEGTITIKKGSISLV